MKGRVSGWTKHQMMDMLRRDQRVIGLLCKSVREHPTEVRRNLSEAAVDVTGQVLVPCGPYPVPRESGGQKTVNILRPFVVPMKSTQLKGPFSSLPEITHALEKSAGDGKLMVTDQALVVLNHFSMRGGRPGAIFNPSHDETPEAFTDEKGRVGLYHVTSTDGVGTAIQARPADAPEPSRKIKSICYRSIKKL
jgi:hypothetical protein